jgi:hypothetical protein
MRIGILLIFFLGFFLICQSQVLVSKEPRHHVVFANDQIRLLNVLLPPGDTTQYHLHSTPSLFITFSATHTASQLINKQPVEGHSKPGDTWFENLLPPHVKVHRVWNMDTSTYHVMDVELLEKDSGFTTPALALPHLQLKIDTPWVRSYAATLNQGQELNIGKHRSALVLVCMNNATLQITRPGSSHQEVVEAAKFYILTAGESFALKNNGAAMANFTLVELR